MSQLGNKRGIHKMLAVSNYNDRTRDEDAPADLHAGTANGGCVPEVTASLQIILRFRAVSESLSDINCLLF